MRVTVLILVLLLLTGCAMVPDTYLSVTPSAGSGSQTTQTNAVQAEDFASLKAAILGFVEHGQTEGTIRVTNYEGDLEQELAEAVYEVVRQDPLGAYAVDYMTHDCTLIVNYYEIQIRTTFRRTVREIAGVETVSTQWALRDRLEKAVDRLESRVTLRLPNYREQDLEALVTSYCSANPETIMEIPEVSWSVYPDTGPDRIVELDLTYTHPAQLLRARQTAVAESLDAAEEYIRYRQTEREKAELLFSYLLGRFSYTTGQSATPLYDALCAGVADQTGLTQAWQLICDRAGLTCYTVEGFKNGEPYRWNILRDGEAFRHLDLSQCILTDGALILKSDPEMQEYSWNQDAYPACEPPVEEPLPPEEPQPPEQPEQPETDPEPPETQPEEPPAEPEAPPEETP